MYHTTSIFEDQPSATVIDSGTLNNSAGSSGPKLTTIIFIVVGVTIVIGATIFFLKELIPLKSNNKLKEKE